MTRPSDLVFEAMKVEYNPIQKKYFVYAKVVNLFNQQEDYHPADYDVFVFDEFNPDTVGATTKLYFCSIVYFDEFAGRPEISHMFLSKNISKVFTNAYEDSDMAIAVYTAMQKDFVNQKVLDKIEEDTDDDNFEFDDDDYEFDDDDCRDYLEWPDDWDLKDDEDNGYFGLKSPTPDISFTNVCYAVSYDEFDEKFHFHIYTSSLGITNEDVDSVITIEKPLNEKTTIYWVNHNMQIFPIMIPVDKEWIFQSISNVFLFKEDAIEYAKLTDGPIEVDGHVNRVIETEHDYMVSYRSAKSNKLNMVKLEKVPSWIAPTTMDGFDSDLNHVKAGTSAYTYFIVIDDSNEIRRIVTKKPISINFGNVFQVRELAERYSKRDYNKWYKDDVEEKEGDSE